MSDEILTAQEAADFLKISTKLLYKLISTGEIHAKKVGNGFRIRKEVLEVYMNDDFDILTPGVLEEGLTDLGYELPKEVAAAIRNYANTEAEKRAKPTLVETYEEALQEIYKHNEGETNV